MAKYDRSMTLFYLKEKCKAYSLKTYGTKAQLAARLNNYFDGQPATATAIPSESITEPLLTTAEQQRDKLVLEESEDDEIASNNDNQSIQNEDDQDEIESISSLNEEQESIRDDEGDSDESNYDDSIDNSDKENEEKKLE